MRRLTALFVDSGLEADAAPELRPDEASNPFVTFDQIPARSRYQYLLDDAQYFVMTFIRGPVCRGQVAVDVIEDHFFVAFLDPDHDLSVIDPTFLEKAKGLLQPARRASEPPRARRVLDPVRHRAAPLSRPARAVLRRARSRASGSDARLHLGRRRQQHERAAHRLPPLRQRHASSAASSARCRRRRG